MFINVVGILAEIAKIAKMTYEYWVNIPQIFSAIGGDIWPTHAPQRTLCLPRCPSRGVGRGCAVFTNSVTQCVEYTENTLGQQTYDLTVRGAPYVSWNNVTNFGTQQPEIIVMNDSSATVQLV